jgi:hypothetical protein
MFSRARWASALAVGIVIVTGASGLGAATGGASPGTPGPVIGPMIPAPAVPGTTAGTQSPKPVELSTNWSGYAATSSSAKFNSAQTDFIQPSITCTAAAAQFMAAWVGLDGFKDKTVEQDGTFATCTGKNHKTPTYVAWYEMFPAGSVEVFPVNAGDEIKPVVTYASGTFTLTITDVTSGQTKTVTATCASCHRASAEWIVERPELCTRNGKCFLASLPDFASVSLTGDSAGTDAAAAAPLSSFTDTPIDMIQPKGPSVELLDQTGTLGTTGDVFSDVWERSGGKLSV